MTLTGTIAGRFRIEAQSASGAMGAVYRAFDLERQATVALKVLRLRRQDAIERFTREATVLAELSHPSIVRYVAHGQEGETLYLAMEWVEGETLSQRLRAQGVTMRESVALCRDLAGALAEVHRVGLIHRDIKPSNVMFPKDQPGVKLVDFGVARRGGMATSITQTGVMVGSPGFMSPEQARGDKTTDERSDIFALGCVLHLCLTGYNPFDAPEFPAMLAKVLLYDPPPVSTVNSLVPPSISAIVSRMLSKVPSDRPCAEEVARELALIEAPETPPVKRQSTPRSTPKVDDGSTVEFNDTGSAVFLLAIGSLPRDDDEDEEGGEEASLDDSVDPEARNPSLPQARAIAQARGARLENLQDGSVICRFVLKDAKDSQSIGDCALEMRQLMPDSPMVIAASTHASAGPDIMEVSMRLLQSEAMEAMFAGAVSSDRISGGIRLDVESARALGAYFPVRQNQDRYYLVPSA